MTDRAVQRMMIDRNGKAFNTEPERNFQAFVDEFSLPFKMNESRDFIARTRKGELQMFSFQLDFVEFKGQTIFETWRATGFLPVNAPIKTDLEIDGADHKDSSDPWKDAAKNNAGVRVVHIPGFLCKRKMWGLLRPSLNDALESPHMTVYLDEYSR